MKKYIAIWYSWGEQEPAVEVPEEKDPWMYMAELASRETHIELTENEPIIDVMLQFSRNMDMVTLYYTDGKKCFYKIVEDEEWDYETDSDHKIDEYVYEI